MNSLKSSPNSPGHVMFNHNPFRVGTNPCALPQGSALARATLGWNWQTPSAFKPYRIGRVASRNPTLRYDLLIFVSVSEDNSSNFNA